MRRRLHDAEIDVDEGLVRGLLEAQFPAFARLDVRPTEAWGTDHAMWRLGDELVVRLPRIDWAAGQVRREASLLPRIAEAVSVRVPRPVGLGAPGAGYPFEWGVHDWVPGEDAALERVADPLTFARELADFILALRRAPILTGEEVTGRGRPLAELDEGARESIAAAADLVDAGAALDVWRSAVEAAAYAGEPVRFHGDLEGNCLIADGRLAGVIDWGLAGIGDPAADVQVAWSPLFTEESSAALLDRVEADEATRGRARGIAVLQACAALPYYRATYPPLVHRSAHKLRRLGVAVRLDE